MQVRRPVASHHDDSAIEFTGRARGRVAYLFEPLEDRRIAGAMATLLPDGLALATPNGAQEIVDSVFADRPAPANAALTATAPAPLAPSPEADPLSDVGDPAKGTRPKKGGTVTTLEESSSSGSGSSTTGPNSVMYVSLFKYGFFQAPDEKDAGTNNGNDFSTPPSYFIFYVSPRCSAGPFPAAVSVEWSLSGDATPDVDYTGSILDRHIWIGVDQGNGEGSALIDIEGWDDDLDEAPSEDVLITLGDTGSMPDDDTPNGMLVDPTYPYADTEVLSGDYTITTTVGAGAGTVANSQTLSPTVAGYPRQCTVTETITWDGAPVDGVSVTFYQSFHDTGTDVVALDPATSPPGELKSITLTTGANGKVSFTLRANAGPGLGNPSTSIWYAKLTNAEQKLQEKEFTVNVMP